MPFQRVAEAFAAMRERRWRQRAEREASASPSPEDRRFSFLSDLSALPSRPFGARAPQPAPWCSGLLELRLLVEL